MDEVTPDGCPAEECPELRVIQEPVGIPRGPVGVVAVDDPPDDVVRLGRFVQERRDRGGVGHSPLLLGATDPRRFGAPGHEGVASVET